MVKKSVTREAPCAALRDQVASVIASEVSRCERGPPKAAGAYPPRYVALLLDIVQDADDHEQGGVVPCIFCPFSCFYFSYFDCSFSRSWLLLAKHR